MGRTILSVLGGFVAWTGLWLSLNAAAAAVHPESFAEDGSTAELPLLVMFLAGSAVFSVISGWLTAWGSLERPVWHSVLLGFLLLVVGIGVQSMYWQVMPLWYHLIFLALLLPGATLGGWIRARHGGGAGAV